MRVGGHTYSFRQLPVDEAIGRLAALGFDRIELWLGHAADAGRARAAVEQHGVQVAAVSAGGVYRTGDDVVVRAAEAARLFRASVVVTCARPDLVPQLTHQAGAGVTVALENHWDQPLARARDVLTALTGRPEMGACLDTGHALNAGESPEGAVAALGDRLVHVHLKDAKRPSLGVRSIGRRARRRLLGRPTPVVPGDGALDVAAVRAALLRAGFAGTVSLEYEGADPEPAVASLLAQWNAAAQAT